MTDAIKNLVRLIENSAEELEKQEKERIINQLSPEERKLLENAKQQFDKKGH